METGERNRSIPSFRIPHFTAACRPSDKTHLRIDSSQNQILQRIILGHEQLVLAQLIRAVPQPLGIDISRDNKTLLILDFGRVQMPPHGRVKCIREAILKQPRHVRVCHFFRHLGDQSFCGHGLEQTTTNGWTLEWKLVGSCTVWRMFPRGIVGVVRTRCLSGEYSWSLWVHPALVRSCRATTHP